ncbi:MAG TPA: neuraminidase-like domain-containing protein [Blastocatellia bacterium]|nr:neuraminidase-like domain-containing protein [Blastocatellia bacterium]
MAGLDEILTDEASVDMPVVGMNVAALLALADQREQGEAITARLQQLPLGNDAFNYLLHIIDKVQTEVEVSESEWYDVYSILIQVAKRRLFAEWRREEKDAKLHLGSIFFHFLDKPSTSVPEWRATAQARRAWDNTLRSRIEQAQAAISALQEAVSATEEETLTLLRDALISATDVDGATPYEKSKWITDNLLIDARASGCQTTTRVAQAIESLQTLLWGIRTGQLSDSQPDWILDADSFDDEWSWIGSYATWRSAMFVFLYPENLALPSLRKYQTPPFREIVERERNGRATPEAACRVANEFAEYFKDVCHLSLEASCRASTRMHDDDPCQNASAEYRLLYYLFARSKSSDKVYWSTYDFRNHSGHAQTLWDAVRGLEGTTKIVGAVPYGGLVFLFAERKNEAGGKELVFTKYDLETLTGWDAPQVVGLPSGTTALRSAVVAQRSSSAAPPLLIINARKESEKYGQVFFRVFTLDESKSDDKDEGENGAAGDWTQLDLTIPGQRNIDRLLALYRFKSGYCLVARYTRNTGESRDYRTHLFNTNLNEQNPGGADSVLGSSKYWRGGWSWPGTNIVVIFEGKTPMYSAFRLSADLEKESTFNGSASSVNFANLGRIAAHCDDDDSGAAVSHIVVAHSMGSGIYLSVLERDLDNNLPNKFRVERRIPVAPQVVLGTFDIPVRLSETERLIRWLLISSVFASHKNFPESVMTYLREAYYFLPMQLALQLQQSGHYTAALDWFRTVYDYSLPPNQRKIYYGLKAEESLGNTFGRAKDWLLDPMNPHAIAATRANSYTRFTLLSIIRCLLDYADNEFTRDTAESVPRARTLYLTALGLLEAKELKQEKNACDKIVGSLQVDVGESWQKAVGVALAGLNKVGSMKKLRSAADAIKRVAADGSLDDEEKVFRITSTVAAARDGASTPMTIVTLTSISKEKITNLHTAMLANPLLFREATESAKIAEDYFVEGAASVSSLQPKELKEGKGDLKWLREPMPTATQSHETHALAANKITPLTFVSKTQSMQMVALNSAFGVGQHYTPKPSIGFCIPPNPVRDSLRMRAELNLLKLRQCRNIAGVVRELEPYAAPTDTFSGMPLVDMGGRLSLPGVSVLKPTPYKYKVLIEHAKELVQLAGQIEGAMLGALEKRDAEAYQLLRARQELNLARAGIQLQNLRVREAKSSVTLAELQRDRAQIQSETYEDWINTGLSELENQMLDAYYGARDAQLLLSRLGTATQIAQAAVTAATADYSAAAAWLLFAGFTQVALLEMTAKGDLIRAESTAQIASVRAGFERRQQEWELQRSLAEQDVKIGDQQIQLANEYVDVVEQEREIAVMQVAHAKEILDFLTNKFTNVELYDWMSNVLEGVYSFFLQRATGMAKVAENQLAFERQEITPAFIKSDYWETPDSALGPANDNRRVPDRRGLTGSARLLQDIYQLDQYAFETDRRKLQLSRVVSLAQLAPVEFQRFRETGVITFATPMGFFDRDFPGHYLRLIKQVRTSIIALIPPTLGVRATLSTTGTSRVIIGGDVFQLVNVSRGLESVALSSPFNATGLFELNPQPDMLLPFEGIGVDTTWEFRLPKASNPFDYSTIADVLITIDYTAMNSYEYRQQVIQQLDTSISIDRAFSFRHQFADAWYDLNNPDQTATPMVVRFQTQRADLPPGIEDLRIQHVVLYFVRQAEASFEVNVSHLRFTEESGMMAGGGATSIDGIISTRRGNAGSWIPLIGKTPTGQWELALPNTEEMKKRFKDEEIENILLVLSYSGQTPAFQ